MKVQSVLYEATHSFIVVSPDAIFECIFTGVSWNVKSWHGQRLEDAPFCVDVSIEPSTPDCRTSTASRRQTQN